MYKRQLWNAVENCEKQPKAQLAYSFDIAMQNELTLEENMELARKFVPVSYTHLMCIIDRSGIVYAAEKKEIAVSVDCPEDLTV